MKKILIIAIFITTCFWFIPKAHASSLDLFWHVNTLVPDDYPGRSLPIRGSLVTITAISEGNYKKLNYSWYLDKNFISYSSGAGKNSFSFVVTQWPGFSHAIKVKAGNKSSSLNIKVREPEVYLEKKQYSMSPGESRTFIARAYYFTSKNLDYTWAFNNNNAQGDPGSNPEFFTLEIPPGYPLVDRKLDITITNPKNFLEKATRRVLIKIK